MAIPREAKHEDLKEFVDTYNSTIQLAMVIIESRLNWFDEHQANKRRLWIIEGETGGIIVWVSFQSFCGRPAYDATVEISIYLKKEHSGKGLGKDILQYCVDTSPKFGIKTLLGFIKRAVKPKSL